MRSPLILPVLAACGRLEFEVARGDARFDDVDPGDAPGDVLALGPWGTPVPLTEVNLISPDDDPSITADGLELYFDSASPRPGAIASGDLFVATRASTGADFATAQVITGLSTASDETRPMISADGLTLRFGGVRANQERDLFVATRASRTTAWSAEMPLGVGDATFAEATAMVVEDGLAVYFDSNKLGSNDIYVARRATTETAWGTPELLLNINDPIADDGEHWVNDDSTLILFGSDRTGDFAIYEATRPSPSVPFSTPRLVSELDTVANDTDPFLSPDLRTIYFASDRGGDFDLYTATR